MPTDYPDSGSGASASSTLDPEHRADLRRSGLTDDTIVAMNVCSLDADGLTAALGYCPGGVQSALTLPYPRLDFRRYKSFPPAANGDGHSIRYLQAKNSGVHLYVLPTAAAVALGVVLR